MQGLEDYRIAGMVTYPLDELLLATLVGVLCGAEDWEEIVCFAQDQVLWLRQFLPYKNGIAAERTFSRVFSLLDSKAFERCFASWVASLLGHVEGVVAIDGKTLRGSKQDASGKGALHIVSAYAHEAGLVMGQQCVEGKSNEITAIPPLLDRLALHGAIVTIDAMGTQTAIAQKIIDKGADYVLALKGNQGNLHKDVQLFFKENSTEAQWHTHETLDAGHGRIETRKCTVTEDIGWLRNLHPDWAGLHTIVTVESTRTDKKYNTTSTETRHYISSLPPDAERILAAIRAHWGIENTLHWTLDVTFAEDANRTRKDHAAFNLATIRKAALTLLRQNNTNASLKKKRFKAALNTSFRQSLLHC